MASQGGGFGGALPVDAPPGLLTEPHLLEKHLEVVVGHGLAHADTDHASEERLWKGWYAPTFVPATEKLFQDGVPKLALRSLGQAVGPLAKDDPLLVEGETLCLSRLAPVGAVQVARVAGQVDQHHEQNGKIRLLEGGPNLRLALR